MSIENLTKESVQTTLKDKVQSALDTMRSYLKADGGDAKIKEINENGTVYIELLGACKDCPISSMTFQAGIEQAIVSRVPEITAVKQVKC